MKDLTQGSVTGNIIAMAAPVAAGMVFQTIYLLVDLYFVARLGDAAVAGVGAAGTVVFAIIALTQVLGVSSVALISQAVGRKDQTSANLVFNQSLVLGALCALVTLAGGYSLSRYYMQYIAADAQTVDQGVSFLQAFIPGMALQFAMMAMASALRGTGIVKPAMLVQVVTVILNTVLAPVLIVGVGPVPALGVFGAGLASTVSLTVGVLMLGYYFHKYEKYVRFDSAMWQPDLPTWRAMLRIGLPAGGEMLLMFVYFGVVYAVIQNFGASAQAGFSIGGRIMQSIFMPTMAIAFAIGPIAGQNFGAGMKQRVRETGSKGMLLSCAVMLVVTLGFQIRPEPLVAFFTDEAAAIAYGAGFLRIVSLNFVAQAVVFSCSGMFQGLGNTRPALLSSAIRLVIFVVLAMVVASRPDYVITHVWYVSVLAVVVQALVSYVLLQRLQREML
ncbi:MAG: MATE family efflux transporter [Gammaproteobacteria bacterium]|nr:MATE family efflux transporter [Gammaproteobacteria bacterium]